MDYTLTGVNGKSLPYVIYDRPEIGTSSIVESRWSAGSLSIYSHGKIAIDLTAQHLIDGVHQNPDNLFHDYGDYTRKADSLIRNAFVGHFEQGDQLFILHDSWGDADFATFTFKKR